MERFPDPLPLPKEYEEQRKTRVKEISRSIAHGVLFRVIIIAAEIAGFFVFGSVSLLADGLASIADVIFSLLLLCGIYFASRDPDNNHPFGHGRFEPLAGLQLALILVVGGAFLAYQQFFSAIAQDHEPVHFLAWIIPFSAVILLETSYRIMTRYAERHNSPALKADAAHFRIDAINSAFAAAALLLGAFFPHLSGNFDHLGALFIALLMVIIGAQTVRSNFQQLTDRRPSETFFSLAKEAAMKVEGVRGVEKTYIQLFGPDAHIDMDIEVDPHMRVDDAHVISQKVRREIQLVWPQVRDVIVHIEPYYPSDH